MADLVTLAEVKEYVRVDGTQDDVKQAYKTIRNELAAYDERLAEKPEIVVLNKIDAIEPDDLKEKLKVLKKISKQDVLLVSGVTGKGTDMVLYTIIDTLDAEKAARLEATRRKVDPNWTP